MVNILAMQNLKTAQKDLQKAIQSPDLLTVSGSRLYGTDRKGSDYDYRGFVVPPFQFIIGHLNFNDTQLAGADHKVYSLQRYLSLVLAGDPQCTEMLFVPREKIKAITHIGERIFSLKNDLISNKIYKRIMGYGYSEWRKAEGVRLQIEDRTRTEDDVILDIRNVFKPEKEDMDEIIERLFAKKEHKKIEHKKNLGAKRKLEFEKYGFGVTSAAHAIRLTQQLSELMTTGHITFPRPNAKYLKNIRLGKFSWKEVEVEFEKSREEAEKAKDTSVLSDKPNSDKVWETFLDINSKYVMSKLS